MKKRQRANQDQIYYCRGKNKLQVLKAVKYPDGQTSEKGQNRPGQPQEAPGDKIGRNDRLEAFVKGRSRDIGFYEVVSPLAALGEIPLLVGGMNPQGENGKGSPGPGADPKPRAGSAQPGG